MHKIYGKGFEFIENMKHRTMKRKVRNKVTLNKNKAMYWYKSTLDTKVRINGKFYSWPICILGKIKTIRFTIFTFSCFSLICLTGTYRILFQLPFFILIYICLSWFRLAGANTKSCCSTPTLYWWIHKDLVVESLLSRSLLDYFTR